MWSSALAARAPLQESDSSYYSLVTPAAPEEGRAEINGDGGEPDHEEAEGDALGVVPHHLQGVQVTVLDVCRQHRAGVQNSGEEVYLEQQQVGRYRICAQICCE